MSWVRNPPPVLLLLLQKLTRLHGRLHDAGRVLNAMAASLFATGGGGAGQQNYEPSTPCQCNVTSHLFSHLFDMVLRGVYTLTFTIQERGKHRKRRLRLLQRRRSQK